VLPVTYYASTIAATGVAFCQNCSLDPASEGTLYFASNNAGAVRRVVPNMARDAVASQRVMFQLRSGRAISLERAPGGGLFVSDFTSIYRIVEK
jgi:hypothetical protein